MFATAFVKRKLGVITVREDKLYIAIEGISRYALERDINKHWGTSVVVKQMFESSNSSTVRFAHFFALDVLYMLHTLYKEGRVKTPRRMIAQVIEKLKENTWLGKIQIDEKDKHIDLSKIRQYTIFKPKDYQEGFIQHYHAVTKAYRLKGYMLDAGPGTGKTLSQMMLAESLNPGGVRIWVVPKNSAESVWEKTILELLKKQETYWHSLMNTSPTPGVQNYITHYEYLGEFLKWFKLHHRSFNNVYVGLDESHKFNRLQADRTQSFLELTSMSNVTNVVWASGTPISALGSECIPFLKCVDPYFTSRVEEKFRAIYGKDAKRANDILRNRIGHLKYHVSSQEVIPIEIDIQSYKVEMPGSEAFTLDAIRADLQDFMADRNKYYDANYSRYKHDYHTGISAFKDTPAYRRSVKDFDTYVSYIKTISAGYDPVVHKTEVMYCNNYERKVIIPAIDPALGKKFRNSASVVKYVHLKVMGEALGLLSKYRSRCFKAMVPHANLPELIDNAKKKTIIFTSYVDVVESAGEYLTKEGYEPILIYGQTNANLPALVKKFFDDKDANPLIATFQSLAEAVPLFVANRIIMMNQPFRDSIKTQAIRRAARLGQDENVEVFDALLDTGTKENISTRNQDILEWSGEMVKSIMGVSNLDLDTLALEAADMNYPVSFDEQPSMESKVQVPTYLYHGSHYKQDELMPGFKRSGVLVKWDAVESNEWLYTTTDPEEAILLGIGSALEKVYSTCGFQFDEDLRTIYIRQGEVDVPSNWMDSLDVYRYRISGVETDDWVLNYNTQNGLTTEYKTHKTIKDSIIAVEKVDVTDYLNGWDVRVMTAESSNESMFPWFNPKTSNLEK